MAEKITWLLSGRGLFHAKYPISDSQSERDFTFLAMRFHAKYPLFDSQSDREFTFSYAILTGSVKEIYFYWF